MQVVRTYITAHTVYPTPEQYKTICLKLVTKFSTLQDTEGQSRYVSAIFNIDKYSYICYKGSWKLSLRNSFKNFKKSYIKDNASKKSSKCLRVYNGDEVDLTKEEY